MVNYTSPFFPCRKSVQQTYSVLLFEVIDISNALVTVIYGIDLSFLPLCGRGSRLGGRPAPRALTPRHRGRAHKLGHACPLTSRRFRFPRRRRSGRVGSRLPVARLLRARLGPAASVLVSVPVPARLLVFPYFSTHTIFLPPPVRHNTPPPLPSPRLFHLKTHPSLLLLPRFSPCSFLPPPFARVAPPGSVANGNFGVAIAITGGRIKLIYSLVLASPLPLQPTSPPTPFIPCATVGRIHRRVVYAAMNFHAVIP